MVRRAFASIIHPPRHYLIFSRKWSSNNDHAVWYRKDKQGYTTDLQQAGRYTIWEALEVERSTHGDCVAIRESDITDEDKRIVVAWHPNDVRFKAKYHL